MAPKPYFIKVSSQKGGVGKTVISINLAITLKNSGKKVLLVDADFANPSVGIHLRFENIETGIEDVMSGNAKLEKAIVKYFPTGLDILPGSISEGEVSSNKLTDSEIDTVCTALQKTAYDYVVFDTSPGITSERFLLYNNEVLLVTTPDTPSITSMIRLANTYSKHGIRNNFVINRFRQDRRQLRVEEIEDVMKKKALGILPEDPDVPLSIEKQIPACLMNEESAFSQGISKLANKIV